MASHRSASEDDGSASVLVQSSDSFRIPNGNGDGNLGHDQGQAYDDNYPGDGLTDSSAEITCKGLDLTAGRKLAVGSGHILNDLCASLWFSYLLLYFENVVGLSSDYAAYLMLLGQIVDGISTPLIGYEADRSSHCIFFCRNYGRCKSWHLFGVILVTLSFPFVFTPCIGCDGADDWAKLVYYAPFIAIFQIGWAATQISHLALIPKMNPDELVRTEMLAIRYGFTVVSNITIFILAWQTFGVSGGQIDSSQALSFRNVAFMAVAIGLICSIIFHLSVTEHTDDFVKKVVALGTKIETQYDTSSNEQSLNLEQGMGRLEKTESLRALIPLGPGDLDVYIPPDQTSNDSDPIGSFDNITGSGTPSTRANNPGVVIGAKYSLSTRCLSLGREYMSAKDWLVSPQFYVVALIFMMTRLSVNVTQVYVPLYLQKSLRLPAETVATIPLTMYIFGFIVACFMMPINKLLGRQLSYTLGALLAVLGSICILVMELGFEGPESDLSKYGIYGVAALLGSGASVLQVTSLCITADLIGNNVESGAFVYGALSFAYKLSCGLAIMIINAMVPCQKDDVLNCSITMKEQLGSFYRYVLAYVSGGCALVGVGGVILVTFVIFLNRSTQAQRIIST